MSDLELKACPFCGTKVHWCKDDHEFHNNGDDCHYINCDLCGEFNLKFPVDLEFPDIYDHLIKAWNNRA